MEEMMGRELSVKTESLIIEEVDSGTSQPYYQVQGEVEKELINLARFPQTKWRSVISSS